MPRKTKQETKTAAPAELLDSPDIVTAEPERIIVTANPDTGKLEKVKLNGKGKGKVSAKEHFLFFPQQVIDAQLEEKEIPALALVETELQARLLSEHGLPAIGLQHIEGFAKTKESKSLHPDLRAFLETCKPLRIFYILYAGCKSMLPWDPEKHPDQDLAKNLNIHHAAVQRLKALTDDDELAQDVYFAHVKEDYADITTSLDELLVKGDANLVVKDLLKHVRAETYFTTVNVGRSNALALKESFRLKYSKGVPEDFYNRYKNTIQQREFVFNLGRYKYDEMFEELRMLAHPEARLYKRIGIKYYKEVQVPNAYNEPETSLKLWSSGEISRDYVQGGPKIQNFFDMIDKYDAFCNVPENDPQKHQQVIDRCYNVFFKPRYAPAYLDDLKTFEANSISCQFLRHIFGESHYTFALDYLSIMYRQPTHPLPGIVLASKENGTGKTKFFEWQMTIYGDNATVINNEQFSNKFNTHYVSKLLIMLDEGFIPLHRKEQKERIKQMITSTRAHMEGKGRDVETIETFRKFWMGTNDEDNFMHLNEQDSRFAVHKVPTVPKKDPDLPLKLKAEIPHFLYLLQQRPIMHQRRDRLWFALEDYTTDALKAVIKGTREFAEQAVSDIVTDYFLSFNVPVLHITLEGLWEKINMRYSGNFKTDKGKIADTIRKKWEKESKNRTFKNIKYLDGLPGSGDEYKIMFTDTDRDRGRAYTFYIDEFLTEQEIKEKFQFDHENLGRLILWDDERARIAELVVKYEWEIPEEERRKGAEKQEEIPY